MKINYRTYCFFVGLLLLFGCAAPVKHSTPSGRPEVTINGATASQVRADLMNVMINRGYALTKGDDFLITFEREIDNVWASVLLGSQYDSTPIARVQFNLIEGGNSVRVVGNFMTVTNEGSAFERVNDMNNNSDTAEFQQQLNIIKNMYESGVGIRTGGVAMTPQYTNPAADVSTAQPVPQLRAVNEAGKVDCVFIKSITTGVGGNVDATKNTERAMNSALGQAASVGADSYYVVKADTTASGATVILEALKCS